MKTLLILLLAAPFQFIFPSPSLAGKNEQEWRASINADIQNKASNFQICKEAVSSAGASNDPTFKSWAYGIARQYCAGTGIEGYDDPTFLNNKPPTSGSPQTNNSSNPNTNTPSGASVNGQPIPLCSHGGLCQGALMRAMGQR